MKKQTNKEIIEEAIEIYKDLEHVLSRSKHIVEKLQSRKFTKEQMETYDIEGLIGELSII